MLWSTSFPTLRKRATTGVLMKMASQPYTLYFNTWSICSQMVRLTHGFRGRALPSDSEVLLQLKEVDIFIGEQLTEEYLCEINPKGQVPALAHPTLLPNPITDSLDITYYIIKIYPNLLPEEHKEHIFSMLHELHAINYFSLSFGTRNASNGGAEAGVLRCKSILTQPDISERYRQALEYKIKVYQSEKIESVEPDEIRRQLKKSQEFLAKVNTLVKPSIGPWIWGRLSPTVLDIQLAVFLARLQDVGLHHLIPPPLLRYIAAFKTTKQWDEVYKDRKTIPGV